MARFCEQCGSPATEVFADPVGGARRMTPGEALVAIARDRDIDALIVQPEMLRGHLMDYCGGGNRRELNLLVYSCLSRVPQGLRAPSSSVLQADRIADLARRMVDEHDTSPAGARWAVETWALALGVSTAPVTDLRGTEPVSVPADIRPITYQSAPAHSDPRTVTRIPVTDAPVNMTFSRLHPVEIARSIITGEYAGVVMTGRYMGKTFPPQEPWYICRIQPVKPGNPKGQVILPQPDLANHKDMFSNEEGPYTQNRLQETVRTLVKNGTLQPVKAKQGTFSTPTGAQDYTDSYFGGATDSTGKPYDASTHAWGLKTRDGNPLVKIKQEDGTHMLWVHKKDRGWLPTIGLNEEGYADINEHHFKDPTFGGNTYLQHQSEMLGEALPGEFLRQNHGVLYRPGSWKREGTLEDVHDNTGHHEGDPSKGAMTSEKAVQMAGRPDAEDHVRDHWNERTAGLASLLASRGGNNFTGRYDPGIHSGPSFTT